MINLRPIGLMSNFLLTTPCLKTVMCTGICFETFLNDQTRHFSGWHEWKSLFLSTSAILILPFIKWTFMRERLQFQWIRFWCWIRGNWITIFFMRHCLSKWADVKESWNEKFDFLKITESVKMMTTQSTAQWTITGRKEAKPLKAVHGSIPAYVMRVFLRFHVARWLFGLVYKWSWLRVWSLGFDLFRVTSEEGC